MKGISRMGTDKEKVLTLGLITVTTKGNGLGTR